MTFRKVASLSKYISPGDKATSGRCYYRQNITTALAADQTNSTAAASTGHVNTTSRFHDFLYLFLHWFALGVYGTAITLCTKAIYIGYVAFSAIHMYAIVSFLYSSHCRLKYCKLRLSFTNVSTL